MSKEVTSKLGFEPLKAPEGFAPLGAQQIAHCSQEEARGLMSFENAYHFGCLPIGLLYGDPTILLIAVSPASWTTYRSKIEFCLPYQLDPIIIEESPLKEAILLAYKGDSKILDQSLKSIVNSELGGDFTENEQDLCDSELASTLSRLLEYAITRQASDLHFVPLADRLVLRFRIAGELQELRLGQGSKKLGERMIQRLRVLSSTENLSRKSIVEGSFSTTIADSKYSIRLSILPTLYGQKAVLRFQGRRLSLRLEDIGLSPHTHTALQEAVVRQHGLILVVGETGSGKTTTLYSLCRKAMESGMSVVTLEDPVEQSIEGASQTSLNENIDFQSGFKALLRHDPDLIMLGEVRDPETALSVISASATGHLIVASLHASSCQDALIRLQDFGIAEHRLSQTTGGILWQKLYPRLCRQCRVIDLANSKKLSVPCYKAVGCSDCDSTGFQGCILVSEFQNGFALQKDNQREILKDQLKEALRLGEISAHQVFPV